MNLEQDAFDTFSADRFLYVVVKRRGKRTYRSKRLKKFLKAEKEPWRQRYRSHINSAHWKVLKLSIIAKRGMSCERCGQHKMSVDLHHLTYVRFGRELPEDVKLLCRDCHKLMHPRN